MTSVYETLRKPPRIRRLVHKGHMPVPWVTCYKDPAATFPLRRTDYGAADTCECVPSAEGKPLLGKQCPARQHAAMSERRCSSCGTRIKGVALFPGVYLHSEHNNTNLPYGTPVTAEAPVHPVCLAYSALACPALFGGNGTLVVPVMADYRMLDRWRVVDTQDPEADDRYEYHPHNTPRPLLILPGRGWPVLETVLARLDQPGLNVTTLDAWMRESAPEPYRSTWSQSRDPEPTLGALLCPHAGTDTPHDGGTD